MVSSLVAAFGGGVFGVVYLAEGQYGYDGGVCGRYQEYKHYLITSLNFQNVLPPSRTSESINEYVSFFVSALA